MDNEPRRSLSEVPTEAAHDRRTLSRGERASFLHSAVAIYGPALALIAAAFLIAVLFLIIL